MAAVQRIAPCLWFDNQAEEAARFYVSIFDNSSIGAIARYPKAGFEMHKRPAGSVMTVAFMLDGQDFLALNGGPLFRFNEAVSLMVRCETQAEVDYYWDKLGEGGGGTPQPCGWLKDRFGLSWQIVSNDMDSYLTGDPEKVNRAFGAVMRMTKPDLAAIRRAYEGA